MICRNGTARPWSYRRKVVSLSLVFCASCIAYVMIFGAADSETGKEIINACADAAMVIISGYILGAVWDDKNKKDKDTNNDAG